MVAEHGLTVSVAETADAALHAVVANLVPQLSRSSAPPSLERLTRIIEDPATTLLLAHAGTDGDAGAPDGPGRVVGMLTLVVFTLPTGVRAWIEDVVVDDASRGGGVASTLIRAAIERADAEGARTVDLTSRPQREAANRLYVRLGFEQRETNVYRVTLEGSG
jgi:ribosomal protein S18 acetylase RimI-like enzyme